LTTRPGPPPVGSRPRLGQALPPAVRHVTVGCKPALTRHRSPDVHLAPQAPTRRPGVFFVTSEQRWHQEAQPMLGTGLARCPGWSPLLQPRPGETAPPAGWQARLSRPARPALLSQRGAHLCRLAAYAVAGFLDGPLLQGYTI